MPATGTTGHWDDRPLGRRATGMTGHWEPTTGWPSKWAIFWGLAADLASRLLQATRCSAKNLTPSAGWRHSPTAAWFSRPGKALQRLR